MRVMEIGEDHVVLLCHDLARDRGKTQPNDGDLARG